MQTKKLLKKIYFFIGTTAELIKLAPVISELEKRRIPFKIISSGQTNVNFRDLALIINKVAPDISLGAKVNKSSLIHFILWSIATIFKSLSLWNEFKGLNKNNSYFIIHGDPISSLIGAFIAKIYGLKLVHIESGLRSFNFLEPFPEEIDRYIISIMADVCFCPNQWSVNNLNKLHKTIINTNYNTLIESVFGVSFKIKSKLKNRLGLTRPYFVLVVHRQEHVVWGRDKSEKLIKYIFDNMPKNFDCVFIGHETTLNFLKATGLFQVAKKNSAVKIVPRLPYGDMIELLKGSEFLATDGGSNQEETYYLGIPCLILRNYTERIEGLGENALLSKGKESIIKNFIKTYKKFRYPKIRIKTRPSKIIVDYLLEN